MLYPLKFKPIYKERIWGGTKLWEQLSRKSLPDGKVVGESWEISGLEPDVSVVSGGPLKGNTLGELVEIYMGELMGDSVYEQFGEEFPLLIKFIDAQDDLSIQVHPNDELAAERHNAYGKTEMWYIMGHQNDAQIFLGFEHNTTPDEYIENLKSGTVGDLLTRFKVSDNQAYYIPAGTVHAIGRGVMLAEIQQTSDITYRIFDWNRKDAKTGLSRELHTEMAMDAIDFSHHRDSTYKIEAAESINQTVELKNSQYFNTSITVVEGSLERDYVALDSFVIYICLDGKLDIKYDNQPQVYTITKGETMLIPAVIDNIELTGSGKILETSIELK